MKKSKISKFIASYLGIFKFITLILFAIAAQSCSKTDDFERVTYSGRVLVYDGPEIGKYDEINTSYLKPFAGVEVFISSCKPWSGILGGGCTPDGKIEETDVTDAEGKYSISFRSYNGISYYPQIDYRSDYKQKSEGYSAATYKDIILIPRSLITSEVK